MTMPSNMDRGAIRSMVEDYWRSFISSAQSRPEMSVEAIKKFDAQVAAQASIMSPAQADTFVRIVDEERDSLFREYRNNPNALKTRLGLYAPLPENGTCINAFDEPAIIDLVQRDYADLQIIARGPGSLRQKGEAVDRELEVRIRSHVEGMNMDESAAFQRTYNREYNRLVMARISARTGQGGCAIVVAAGLGACGALYYAGNLLS